VNPKFAHRLNPELEKSGQSAVADVAKSVKFSQMHRLWTGTPTAAAMCGELTLWGMSIDEGCS